MRETLTRAKRRHVVNHEYVGVNPRAQVVEVEHPSLDASELERRARRAEPPVIGLVRTGRFRLDPRTLTETELGMAATALGRAWGA